MLKLEVNKTYKNKVLLEDEFAPVWTVIGFDGNGKNVAQICDQSGYKTEIDCAYMEEYYVEVAEKTMEKTCWHDWTNYVGFTESYQYCKNCGEKKYV